MTETGSYSDGTVIRASVVGSLEEDEGRTFIQHKAQLIPRVGNGVIARVFNISLNKVSVRILSVDLNPLKEFFLGVIRIQDIRRYEIDKIDIEDCFRPGDIIKARIISLGDSKSFFLSTAEAQLGVMLGWNELDNKLIPFDWEHLIDPSTGTKYKRKVAKPN